MKKVLIATGPGFQDEEVIYPKYRFQEDFSVDIVTSSDKVAVGKYGTKVTPTITKEKVCNEIFDCIFVPGGHEAPDRVRQCEEILRCIERNYNNGCLITTILRITLGCDGQSRDVKSLRALWVAHPERKSINLLTKTSL